MYGVSPGRRFFLTVFEGVLTPLRNAGELRRWERVLLRRGALAGRPPFGAAVSYPVLFVERDPFAEPGVLLD